MIGAIASINVKEKQALRKLFSCGITNAVLKVLDKLFLRKRSCRRGLTKQERTN